jgi:hypothetical protein
VNLTDLLSVIEDRGVKLELRPGNKLGIDAPVGALSPAVVQALARHKGDLLQYLIAISGEGGWIDPEFAGDLGPTCLPPEHEPPKPPRPDTPPTHGLTRGGHVVELPRALRGSTADPLKLVTGPHWPCWYRATESDHRYVSNPEKTERPEAPAATLEGLSPNPDQTAEEPPAKGGAS